MEMFFTRSDRKSYFLVIKNAFWILNEIFYLREFYRKQKKNSTDLEWSPSQMCKYRNKTNPPYNNNAMIDAVLSFFLHNDWVATGLRD